MNIAEYSAIFIRERGNTMDSFWDELKWLFFFDSVEKEDFETAMKILEAHPEMNEELEEELEDCGFELTDEEVEEAYQKLLKQICG